MPGVDRGQQFSTMVKNAWCEGSIVHRFRMVLMIFTSFILCMVPRMLGVKLGVFRFRSLVGKPVAIWEGIYQINYECGASCNATVLVARDGSKDILLHSAPPATPEIVSAVRSLGKVAVVFVPSLAHESFAGEWAAKFPEAKVVCPKTVMEEIKTATGRVDLAYDDLTSKSVQDLMKKYGVVEVIPTKSWMRFDDAFLKLELEDGRFGLLTSCGFMNFVKWRWSPRHFLWFVSGFARLGLARQFSLCFVHNLEKAYEQWNSLRASIPSNSLALVAFQHGDPLLPMQKSPNSPEVAVCEQMKAANILASRTYFWGII